MRIVLNLSLALSLVAPSAFAKPVFKPVFETQRQYLTLAQTNDLIRDGKIDLSQIVKLSEADFQKMEASPRVQTALIEGMILICGAFACVYVAAKVMNGLNPNPGSSNIGPGS